MIDFGFEPSTMFMNSLNIKMACIMNFYIAKPSLLKTFIFLTFSLDHLMLTRLYVRGRLIAYEKGVFSQSRELCEWKGQ